MDALDEIIDVLVKHGADPDIKNYLQTAAMVDSSEEEGNDVTDIVFKHKLVGKQIIVKISKALSES